MRQNEYLWSKGLTLPNDKILNLSNLKALADYKINVTEKLELCFGKGRKHSGKRRKCWSPAFSPFPHNVFKRPLILSVVKCSDCVVKN